MKKENGYWIDENNNKWNCDTHTKDQALKKSKSLVNCFNCIDCFNCYHCNYCGHCDNCNYCDHCNYCNYCNYCDHCDNCDHCNYCNYCNYCDHCDNCNYCDHCNYCNYCNYCDHCNYCNYCDHCNDFKSNPERIISKNIGSRNSQTTIYKYEDKLFVVCGCFNGNLKDFEEAIEKTHGNNEYGMQYKEFINRVKLYFDIKE